MISKLFVCVFLVAFSAFCTATHIVEERHSGGMSTCEKEEKRKDKCNNLIKQKVFDDFNSQRIKDLEDTLGYAGQTVKVNGKTNDSAAQ